MAITTGTATFVGAAPLDGQVIVNEGLCGNEAKVLEGYATVTGDAASATFDVNFIDGTQAISFTPTAVICVRSGGAATSTIAVTGCTATNKKITVNTSANVNAATFQVAFRLLP